jgi:hypothetical protein
MPAARAELTGALQGVLLTPAAPTGLGVLVLAGSSGRVDEPRAALFAERGAHALALRWFGGDGQASGICEIPLETFVRALDQLASAGATRFAIVGVSKGAEAALLTAIRDPRVEITVAISPSSHVWANIGPGLNGLAQPERSSWTWRGKPLPFVASDVTWQMQFRDGAPAYRTFHEASLLGAAAEAVIPIEQAKATIVLVAGADDALWPSDSMARTLAGRLNAAGKSAVLIEHVAAGHRIPFPGEPLGERNPARHWGGADEADRALGMQAWSAISKVLDLPT